MVKFLVIIISFFLFSTISGDPNPDFIQLAQKAFPGGNMGPREDLDKLWIEMFKLPEWLFLMSPKSAKSLQPSVQMIEGKGWLLVFTDSEKLQAYAKKNKNVDEKGSALYLSMSSEKAREYLKQFENSKVFGVRFNEGAEQGWFAPVRNITLIFDFLVKNGKL